MCDVYKAIGKLAVEDVEVIIKMAEGNITSGEVGNCFFYWYHNEELMVFRKEDGKNIYSFMVPSEEKLMKTLYNVLHYCGRNLCHKEKSFFSKELISRILADPMAMGYVI